WASDGSARTGLTRSLRLLAYRTESPDRVRIQAPGLACAPDLRGPRRRRRAFSIVALMLVVAPDEHVLARFGDFVSLALDVACDFLEGRIAVAGARPRSRPAGPRPEHLEPLFSSVDPNIRERALTISTSLRRPGPIRR